LSKRLSENSALEQQQETVPLELTTLSSNQVFFKKITLFLKSLNVKQMEFYSIAEGNRSLAYLQSIQDDLFIQLFDEVTF
jgi:hypothetical protein